MKRTYPTNVDGQIFYIDEDAFELLQNYLKQLKETFHGTEGEEIVGDIESRIRELFNEKINGGAGVIVLADVEQVIETMGRPEELSEDSGSTTNNVNGASFETNASATANGESTTTQSEPRSYHFSLNMPSEKKLFRNMSDKVFGGVFGGLGVYLGWNANIMRILYIILTISTKGLFCFLVYLIAWMVIPAANTPRRVLQMKGEPINVNTVGQAVINESPTTPPATNKVESTIGSFFNNFFSIIGKCIMAFIAVATSFATFIALIIFFSVLTGTIACATVGFNDILVGMNLHSMAWGALAAILTGSLIAIIIFGMITWGCLSALTDIPSIHRNTLITLSITVMILIVATIVLSCMAGVTI